MSRDVETNRALGDLALLQTRSEGEQPVSNRSASMPPDSRVGVPR
jgi:hypothetical protein